MLEVTCNVIGPSIFSDLDPCQGHADHAVLFAIANGLQKYVFAKHQWRRLVDSLIAGAKYAICASLRTAVHVLHSSMHAMPNSEIDLQMSHDSGPAGMLVIADN